MNQQEMKVIIAIFTKPDYKKRNIHGEETLRWLIPFYDIY